MIINTEDKISILNERIYNLKQTRILLMEGISLSPNDDKPGQPTRIEVLDSINNQIMLFEEQLDLLNTNMI